MAKCSAKSAMSSRRSRSGGKVMTSKGEPVQKVQAEATRRREPRQILVGGRDHAHVRAQGPLAADPLVLAVFDDAQQLLLHEAGGGRQFVEKQGAAVGAFESALMGAGGAGERAGLVAEQLAFDQRVADGGAVQL